MTTPRPPQLRAQEREAFARHWPRLNDTLPEFFRVMAIGHQSFAQRDIFGNPQGIRRDLGFETVLKLVMIAAFDDHVLQAQDRVDQLLDKLRRLCFQWWGAGGPVEGAAFFAHYLYDRSGVASAVVRELRDQIGFLIDPHQGDAGAKWLVQTHSQAWYQVEDGLGDKRHDLFVALADARHTGLPRPGWLVHFGHSQAWDLRVPAFVAEEWLETPTYSGDRVIVRCPECGQRCRGKRFPQIEVHCPHCGTTWVQRT